MDCDLDSGAGGKRPPIDTPGRGRPAEVGADGIGTEEGGD